MTRTTIGNCVRLVGILALTLLCSLGPPSQAHAASFVVDSLGDEPDANVGDGFCATAGGLCTLRAALQEANASAGATITFSVTGTITPATALPFLSSGNITIAGANQTVTIDGSRLPAWTTCLVLNSNNTVKGIVVANCPGNGISLGGSGNTIGGTTPSERNVIRDNGAYGISVAGSAATENQILGNYIGVNSAGNQAAPNYYNGVTLGNGAWDNIVGGSSAGARNVISGNDFGVMLLGAGPDNVIQGNYIGLDSTGTFAIGNHQAGIGMVDATSDTWVLDNVISGNQISGVYIAGGFFYDLSGAEGSGSAPIQLNGHIDFSSGDESWSGDAADGEVPRWNFFSFRGATLTISVLAPAGGCGSVGPIWLNEIGGAFETLQITAGADGCPGPGGTVFSWSQPISIPAEGPGTAADNVFRGNKIGTNAAGNAVIANAGGGIEVWNGAIGTLIGGPNPGEGNVIAYNQGHGVKVNGSGTLGNTIRGNSIYSNGGKGIENINGGNLELAPPIIDGVGSASGHTDPKCYPCTVEVFSDTDGQGRVFHGSTTTNNDATGTWIYPGKVTGPNITATITDAAGNTSQFSAPVAYSPPVGVGGIVKLPPAAIAAESSAPLDGPDRSTDVNAALAGIVSAAALAAGGWYLRRRWRC